MSLREWLIAIGALVLIVIVIDGLRRMRRARKDSLTISSGMGVEELDGSPLDDDYNPELPNGGARPVSSETLEQRGYLTKARKPVAEPEPPASEQDDWQPERMSAHRQETATTADRTLVGMAPMEEEHPASVAGEELAEDIHPPESVESLRADPEENTTDTTRPRKPGAERASFSSRVAAAVRETVREHRADRSPVAEPEPPTVTTEVEEDTARRDTRGERSPDQPLAGANRPPAEEVVVINVLAREKGDFSGKALKNLFEACGLEHGDLDIYHRHETSATTSPVQFSVANAVEPGTFTPDTMAGTTTPGISFFMSLPGPGNSLQAFEFMLETAQCVVRNLGGELKDERRSVMTAQTIEHCRQRIREYERKRHSRR